MDESDDKFSNSDLFTTGYLLAGRYEIVQLLGVGGMGAVYLARDRILASEPVAIKVLHKQLAFEKKYTQRFLREVQLMRRVNHRNVVRTFDVGTEGDTVYLTMEYAPGRSLLSLMESRAIGLDDLPAIFIQIAEGLQAIHDAAIIHRDLKPENVIITGEGIVKITDFGVARPELSQLTAHDEIIGSAAYMAPEVWRGEPLTTAVDIYAMGVMLYEAAAGKLPFDGDSPAVLMRHHLDDTPLPLKNINRAVPQWLNRLTQRLLAKNPVERPNSAREVIDIITAETARLAKRRSVQTEAVAPSSEESANLLTQLEQRSKRAADSKSTVSLTVSESERLHRNRDSALNLLIPKTSRTSAVLRPLRLGKGHLQSYLQRFVNTCDGVPYFLTYAILLIGMVGGLNVLFPTPEQEPALGSSLFALLQSHAIHTVSVILWLSLPTILLATFSGNLMFIFRLSSYSILLQLIVGIGLTASELIPAFGEIDIDGRSISIAASAAATKVSEISWLSARNTTFSHTILAQGIALHSPERHFIWESMEAAIPTAIYLCWVCYCLWKASHFTNRNPKLSASIASIWIVGLIVVQAFSTYVLTWMELPLLSSSHFFRTFVGGFDLPLGALVIWGGLYICIGILGPLLSGPADRH